MMDDDVVDFPPPQWFVMSQLVQKHTTKPLDIVRIIWSSHHHLNKNTIFHCAAKSWCSPFQSQTIFTQSQKV